jgi:hypothetical protein
MIDEPSENECKELYAHFGLAFYCSNLLEHEIANALFILELLDGRGGAKTKDEWEALVDKYFEDSFERTLGKLRQRLSIHQHQLHGIASVMDDLAECVQERNFLAHHFWREHAVHWHTRNGRELMVQRLEKARDLFSKVDNALQTTLAPHARRHGITEEMVRRELALFRCEAQKII